MPSYRVGGGVEGAASTVLDIVQRRQAASAEQEKQQREWNQKMREIVASKPEEYNKDYVNAIIGNQSTTGIAPITRQGMGAKETARQDKMSAQQDRLEQQAIDRVARLRGDASVARTEVQRDASIQAYKTIDRVKQEDRLPSQIEYYDLLGQMWKARTGASPTDQALRDLDAKTFKGNFAKAVQYFTGKPAGITTADILQNVQDFAKDSGIQADMLHENYMKSHLIKPTGLDEDRWQPIFNTERGISFRNAVGLEEAVARQTGQAQGPVRNFRSESEVMSARLPKGTRITINGRPAVWE